MILNLNKTYLHLSMKDDKKIRKGKKYTFTLKNINTEQIDKKYNISLLSNLENSNLVRRYL